MNQTEYFVTCCTRETRDRYGERVRSEHLLLTRHAKDTSVQARVVEAVEDSNSLSFTIPDGIDIFTSKYLDGSVDEFYTTVKFGSGNECSALVKTRVHKFNKGLPSESCSVRFILFI